MSSRKPTHQSEVGDAGEAVEEPPQWSALPVSDVARLLASTIDGLDPEEVATRSAAWGPNTVSQAPPPSGWAVLAHQFTSPLVYILLIATAITVAIAEYVDAGVIFAVLALNAGIGFVQERKAEDAVRALMGLVAPRAHVSRQGRKSMIDSSGLVPGDVVLLESGQRVPADVRLVETTNLTCDESLLTGESVPVAKASETIAPGAVVADRVNMALMGTVVSTGRGKGFVVATGAHTELGKIATQIRQEEEPPTPLQRRMAYFARMIGVAVAVSALLSVPLGILRGESMADMFLVAVALAVSAIPEGLPVVFTITLAVGVQRMARRRAIIRRLPAVETLGSVTVIGSDKTGTLTANRMTVQQVWAGEAFHDVGAAAAPPAVRATLRAGILANEASFAGGEATGDPTEVALLEAGEVMGVGVTAERARWAKVAEIPFESEHRYSAVFASDGNEQRVFVKGAPERVMEMCSTMAGAAGEELLDAVQIESAVADLAGRGMRVLAMAEGESRAPGSPLTDLRFLGLQGMIDPPRPGVPEAVAACRSSGIRVVMITGDHAETALAISRSLGFPPGEALTGAVVEGMTDAQLVDTVATVSVFARVSPEHKLRVVRSLQARQEVVAVTGDGVNDAPALKAAEVGVSMGKSGTDVAREASDMVLADDNFVSIVEAIRQGRVAFDNLRKVTFFLISSGAAAVLVILTAVAAGWPLPMIPAQILWLNLVTNGIQDVALAFEPAEPDVTARRPRPRDEGIVSKILWYRTLLSGAVMAAGTLGVFAWIYESGSLIQAQTGALTMMVAFQAIHVGNARSEHVSAFRVSPFSNRFLLIAVLGSLAVHVAALYLPFTQFVLRVEPIDLSTWLVIAAVSLTVLMAVEIDKWVRSRRS